MPVAAHTRQERRGALARSDRLTADLGSPDTPMLAHTLAWRRRDRFRPSRLLTGLTHSPCHQGRYPSALQAVGIGRMAEAHCRSKFALVGISREWEPRGRLASGNCNHLNLTQSPSCGRSSSSLSDMATGRMAEAHSHYERASSALLARSYAHSVHVC